MRAKRVVQAFGITILVASGLVTGSTMVASAACHGVGVNFNSNSGWASETSSVATCDGLNDYFGTVSDIAADGWKVRVETIWINGSGSWVPTANTAGSLPYNYGDNNSSTNYRMVRADGATAATGSNYGF
jgi:hypothetical protein